MPTTGHSTSEPNTWQERIFPFALVICWAAITAVLSLLFFKALDESRARVTGTHDVLMALNELLSAAKDAETGQRGYLITQNDSYLSPYRQGLETGQSILNRLEAIESGNTQHLARIAALRTLWTEKSREIMATIEIAHEKGIEAARAAVANDRGKVLMDQLRQTVSEMETVENVTRAGAIADQKTNAWRLLLFTQITTLVGFGALLYLLTGARRTAAELKAEVSSRQSAEELSRERAEQALRMRVMNRELVHRTKNLISVVQAIVRNQEKGSPEIDRYVTGLSNRLVSLGSTLDILVRENWHQVMLEDLIAGQLGHFSEDISTRIAVTPGPPIKFTASEAQMLGLALHELGTNAAKYGALSIPEGRIDIRWTERSSEDGPAIVLRWSEENGPPVEAPTRRGFGSRITESLVARAVGGSAAIDYFATGLTWTLTFKRDRLDPDDEVADNNEAATA